MRTIPTRQTPAKRGNPYPDDVKERALELVRETGGYGAAHRETGVSKTQIGAWVREAGIELDPAIAARTARATAATVATTAEAREELARNLTAQALGASRVLVAVAGVSSDFVAALDEADPSDLDAYRDEETGRWLVTMPEAAKAELARAAALAQLPTSVRDLVGVQTRAIADLEVVEGRAVAQGGVTVVFEVPRPQMGDAPAPLVVPGVVSSGQDV